MSRYPHNRRKNYYIDKDFQMKFIVKFCFVIIVASIATATLIYYFNLQTTTVAFENLRVTVKTTSDFILPIVLQILAIVTIVAGILTVYFTMFTSHKISGPLYKLNVELKKIKDGDFTTPIRIRSTDQLQQIANNFDDFRKNMQETIKRLQSKCDEAENACSKDEISKIKKKIQTLKDELSQFNV